MLSEENKHITSLSYCKVVKGISWLDPDVTKCSSQHWGEVFQKSNSQLQLLSSKKSNSVGLYNSYLSYLSNNQRWKTFSSVTLSLLILAPSLIAVFYWGKLLYMDTKIHSQLWAKTRNKFINTMFLFFLTSSFVYSGLLWFQAHIFPNARTYIRKIGDFKNAIVDFYVKKALMKRNTSLLRGEKS